MVVKMADTSKDKEPKRLLHGMGNRAGLNVGVGGVSAGIQQSLNQALTNQYYQVRYFQVIYLFL